MIFIVAGFAAGLVLGAAIVAARIARWGVSVVAVAMVLSGAAAIVAVERRRLTPATGTPIAQPPPDMAPHGELVAPLDEETKRAVWRSASGGDS